MAKKAAPVKKAAPGRKAMSDDHKGALAEGRDRAELYGAISRPSSSTAPSAGTSAPASQWNAV